jgi:pheromone shutdown protein TraB
MLEMGPDSLKCEIILKKLAQAASCQQQFADLVSKATALAVAASDAAMSTLPKAEREQMAAEQRVRQDFLAEQRLFETAGLKYGQEFDAAIEETLALAELAPRKLIAIDQPDARTVKAVTNAMHARDKQRAALWRRVGRAARRVPMQLLTAWSNSFGRCNCKFCCKRGPREYIEYVDTQADSTRAAVRAADADFKRQDPLVYAALVSDRDVYMADSTAFGLFYTASKCSVAVVGIGHIEGIENHLMNTYHFTLMSQ